MQKDANGHHHLRAREYIALGIALFLTVPSMASIIISIRFVGRMIRPLDFLLHYGTISLFLGFASALLMMRLMPRRAPAEEHDRQVKNARQGILYLTCAGTTALLVCFFSVINAVMDRSEGTTTEAVVVAKERRRLYKGPATYVTVSIALSEKEFLVPDPDWQELEAGLRVPLLLRKGFLGYEHIERIIISRPPALQDEEVELDS